MNTQELRLDLSKQAAVRPIVAIRQGDRNGTKLDVEIYDNGTPLSLSNAAVALCVLLPGEEDSYIVSGTAQGSTASFTIDETYAAAYTGRTDIAYVEVTIGESVCSTQAFELVIEKGARL